MLHSLTAQPAGKFDTWSVKDAAAPGAMEPLLNSSVIRPNNPQLPAAFGTTEFFAPAEGFVEVNVAARKMLYGGPLLQNVVLAKPAKIS